MLNLFKQNAQDRPLDVKMIRDYLLQFIKQQLKKMEGGEGKNIRGMELFIACSDEERPMYEAAVYYEEKDRFKNEEVQKIADDFAIEMPQSWTLDVTFTESLPFDAQKIPGTDAALFVQTARRSVSKTATAYITILSGEAEKEVYTISSSGGKINIGREKKVQTADGFFRENQIAFPASSENKSNQYISRQHAHIEFDEVTNAFLLFADEGGVPPRNKIKVCSAQDRQPVKLFSTQFGHPLQEGDQIMLGDSAILQFSFSKEEN